MQNRLILISLSFCCLTSCFKKDEPLPPYIWDGKAYTIGESIYSHQIFFDLNTNNAAKVDSIIDWDLSFESSAKGWRIRINGGNQVNIYPTDITDFTTTQFQINFRNWRYDTSNGDPDSTAIGTWVDTQPKPFQYTGKIYLVGRNSSNGYQPVKKIQFEEVNDTSYRFMYADINGSNQSEVIIQKDTSCNYSYFSITSGRQVKIEPPRDTWDIMFTQYLTTLYTKGIPVPYFVRGVLINPYKVQAAADSSSIFDNIQLGDIGTFQFKTTADVIGYNWKTPDINVQANSARYTIRENYHYIIRDTKGDYYKLRFLNFYNTAGEEGFPTFIFKKL